MDKNFSYPVGTAWEEVVASVQSVTPRDRLDDSHVTILFHGNTVDVPLPRFIAIAAEMASGATSLMNLLNQHGLNVQYGAIYPRYKKEADKLKPVREKPAPRQAASSQPIPTGQFALQEPTPADIELHNEIASAATKLKVKKEYGLSELELQMLPSYGRIKAVVEALMLSNMNELFNMGWYNTRAQASGGEFVPREKSDPVQNISFSASRWHVRLMGADWVRGKRGMVSVPIHESYEALLVELVEFRRNLRQGDAFLGELDKRLKSDNGATVTTELNFDIATGAPVHPKGPPRGGPTGSDGNGGAAMMYIP